MSGLDAPAQPKNDPPSAQPVVPHSAIPGGNLTYEQQTPWFAQRKAFRLIVLLLILNIIAVTSITWGPITVRAVQERIAAKKAAEAAAQAAVAQQQAAAAQAAALQAALAQRAAQVRQCLTFPLTPNQVVYTEDFVEAARLVADGKAGYSAVSQTRTNPSAQLPHPPVVWDGTPELRAVTAAFKQGTASGNLFLGGRKTPAGQSRLVWIYVRASRDATSEHDNGGTYVRGPVERYLTALVLDPDHPTDPGKVLWRYRLDMPQRPEQVVRVVVDPPSRKSKLLRNDIDRAGEPLRLMAGTADPGDASRLTLPYSIDGRRGTIDVRLQDDDRLRVTVDRGEKGMARFDRSEGHEVWELRGDGNGPAR